MADTQCFNRNDSCVFKMVPHGGERVPSQALIGLASSILRDAEPDSRPLYPFCNY